MKKQTIGIASWKVLIALCLLVIIVAPFTFIVWLNETDFPKRDRYLIPENYSGWLCITYSVPDAPALKTEDGYRLVKFPLSGIVETSTEGMPGKYKDEFWRYSGSTRREMDTGKELGGGYTVSKPDEPDQYTHMFWVSADVEAQQPPTSDESYKCDPKIKKSNN